MTKSRRVCGSKSAKGRLAGCGRLFWIDHDQRDLMFCPQCRASILALEGNSHNRRYEELEARLQASEWMRDENRILWDYQINDEYGRTVWASDLANRYRSECFPRGTR